MKTKAMGAFGGETALVVGRRSHFLVLTIQASSEALKSDDLCMQLSEFVPELLLRIFQRSRGLEELLVVENSRGAQYEVVDELMGMSGEWSWHLQLFFPDAITQCPDGDPLLRFECLAIDVLEQFVELRKTTGIESHRHQRHHESQQEQTGSHFRGTDHEGDPSADCCGRRQRPRGGYTKTKFSTSDLLAGCPGGVCGAVFGPGDSKRTPARSWLWHLRCREAR